MFKPNYQLTPEIAQNLMHIENSKARIEVLPMNLELMKSLRESARLQSTHYSTQIEGNRLTQDEVDQVVFHKGHFPGRQRDEKEVLGYYCALEQVEKWVSDKIALKACHVQKLHALVMGGGKSRVRSSPFRDGQNVIRDSANGSIVYLPPEAKDVPDLIDDLVSWAQLDNIPTPVKAGLVHYQFATIHPYYDGNGRTARLLTTLIMHLNNYGLNGLYSLEEYYARHLGDYYDAISIGPSHNYYLGRAEADITPWLDYFCKGMVYSFKCILDKAQSAGPIDEADLLRRLDPKKRRLLSVIDKKAELTSLDIAQLFQISPRASRALCQKWLSEGFLQIIHPAKRNRLYKLANIDK